MQSYRCFLLLHAATVGVRIIEAESDLEATERAEAVVLDSGNKFDGYELWDGTRQVKRVQGIHREWDDTREQIHRWRMKAEELRAAAEGFASQASRDYFLHTAQTYEALANSTEARLDRRKRNRRKRASSGGAASSRLSTGLYQGIIERRPVANALAARRRSRGATEETSCPRVFLVAPGRGLCLTAPTRRR